MSKRKPLPARVIDCEWSLILAMAIVGRAKYTRARAKFREDATRGERQKVETTDLGCVSLGESENGFVIPDHLDSSTPKKRKIRKRIILS